VAEKIPKVLGKVELKLSMKMVFLIPSHPIDESSISLCFPWPFENGGAMEVS
jgi:hypothetical protein